MRPGARANNERALGARPAPLDLGHPRPVQRARRLDPDHRPTLDAGSIDQPLELVDALAQTGSVTGSPIKPRSPVVNHTRF
jgi:hypothetical protein